MENYKELFLKYLQNECDQGELEVLLDWLKDPANVREIEDILKEDWSTFQSIKMNTVSNQGRSFETLKQKLEQINAKEKFSLYKEDIIQTGNNHKIRRIMVRIAASFLLPIAVGYFTFLVFEKNKKMADTITFNEITAPLGSKTRIDLCDGTKVWLNSGSKIKIPQKFVGNYREVQLVGEAFFDVKKDPSRPFIVRTSKLNVKVLGTSFNVKAYPEEGTIETTLVNGLVTITKHDADLNSKEVVYLKPNQRVTYVKETGKLVLTENEKKLVKENVKIKEDKKREEKLIFIKNVDTEQFVAWKDDKLVFKNEDFESLSIKLKRWYGVEININSEELKKYHYTGVLQKETINDVIRILRLTMPFEYEINHNVIDLWSEKDKKKSTHDE